MIFLSAGHYPARPGVRLGPVTEHEIVYELVWKMIDRDPFVPSAEHVPTGTLAEKIAWINQRTSGMDDLAVELHLNSVQGYDSEKPPGPSFTRRTPYPYGCECWYYRWSSASETAAATIQNHLSSSWGELVPGYQGRGIRRSAGLRLLRDTKCRAVIVEIEFVWNAAAVLAFADHLVDALADGIVEAL